MYVFFMELYATLEPTVELEKAYVRDAIFSSSGYATECLKLTHFETSASTLKGTMPGTHCFAYTSKMGCLYAINHLVTYGVLAIVESRASAASPAFTSAAVVPPDFKGKTMMTPNGFQGCRTWRQQMSLPAP
ncbi:SYP124 protein [Hibiscus syriacus]|uniref:SYP124 protein n=1 Tax=Hibiscus syriacus TaxID=106335 RepID=A0A6A3CIN6_HIBSY|nr:vacuolar protein sorting-associated protein 28 homolog 1-like [Hibiscus syriacus]KAE8728567.1 SYP124 protein [Hibiscus syriacus]